MSKYGLTSPLDCRQSSGPAAVSHSKSIEAGNERAGKVRLVRACNRHQLLKALAYSFKLPSIHSALVSNPFYWAIPQLFSQFSRA